MIFSIRLLLLCALCTTFLHAQNYSISGRILDQEQQPIAFANVYLLVLENGVERTLTGAISEEDGRFSMMEVPAGEYELRSSYLGYQTFSKQINLSADLTVDIVLSESAETLDEVSIVVKRPTLVRTPDRLVFSVANTALSEGNMLEVVSKTPGVLILDDQIKVKNMTPTVYINDRKVYMSSSDLLSLLEGNNAANVQSVEVITNPSARYDADSGVVLNIRLSQSKFSGFNGSIFSNFTQGVFPKLNHGANIFFKGRAFSLTGSYTYNDAKIDRVNRELVRYPDQTWTSGTDRNTWSETHNANLNMAYVANNKSNLAFNVNAQFLPYFKYLSYTKTDIASTVNPIDNFRAVNLSRDIKHNVGMDLDYNYQFKAGHSIRTNIHYTNYDYRRKQQVNSSYFLDNNQFLESTAFRTRADQSTAIWTGQVDYSQDLGKTSSWSAGVKVSDISTISGIRQFDAIGGSEVLNLQNTNQFDYSETVFAGYVDFVFETGSLQWNAGLRAEQTDIEGISDDAVNSNTQNYLEWFPTLSVGKQLNATVLTYLNYKRSIRRPDFVDLNPFRFYLNDNTVITGNPALQPQFTNEIKWGWSIKNRFIIETYYRMYDNTFIELPIQDNLTNIITYTNVNIDESREWGIDLEANIDMSDRWRLYAGTSVSYYKDTSNLLNAEVSRDQWTNYSIVSNDFTFLKDRSLMLNVFLTYVGKNLQGLQLVDDRWVSEITLKKTFMKGNAILSLFAKDIFNAQDFLVTTRFLNQDSRIFTNLDNRLIGIGFRYKFGKTNFDDEAMPEEREERDRLED